MDTAPFQLEVTQDAPAVFHAPPCSGSLDLRLGNCLDVLRTMPDNSVDSIVTDPPYGLSFMGKKWDYDVPSEDIWRECLRVLKPGGHLLAFAGTRTQHRMAVRIEDAGFEIRDMLAWVYATGFPKSLNVSIAIDKAAGSEREVVGVSQHSANRKAGAIWGGTESEPERNITAPATDAAKQWDGFGTALKPALEPLTLARKPLIGTVAANVLKHGTGAINIDGCRVGTDESTQRPCGPDSDHAGQFKGTQGGMRGAEAGKGRWPANLIHDGSDEVVGLLNDAARFFYCPKASKKDRDEGLEGFDEVVLNAYSGAESRVGKIRSDGAIQNASATAKRNHHPTVKPTALMRYLCRLVTPPGGIVLDPFMGSGSTGKAAVLEGFNFIGCERDPEYFKIAQARISRETSQAELFSPQNDESSGGGYERMEKI